MVPGAASAEFVAPMRVRTICHVSSGPSTTITSTGPLVMNSTRAS